MFVVSEDRNDGDVFRQVTDYVEQQAQYHQRAEGNDPDGGEAVGLQEWPIAPSRTSIVVWCIT